MTTPLTFAQLDALCRAEESLILNACRYWAEDRANQPEAPVKIVKRRVQK